MYCATAFGIRVCICHGDTDASGLQHLDIIERVADGKEIGWCKPHLFSQCNEGRSLVDTRCLQVDCVTGVNDLHRIFPENEFYLFSRYSPGESKVGKPVRGTEEVEGYPLL